MIKFYELNNENRIIITADTGRLVKQEDDTIVMEGEQFDFPDDFVFDKQNDYKIVNGELVYDPLPEPEVEPSETESLKAQVAQLTEELEATKILLGVD